MNWYKRANLKGRQVEAINWKEIKSLLMMGAVGGILAAPIAVVMISKALQMPPQQVKQEIQANPQAVAQKLEQIVPTAPVNQPAVQAPQPQTQQVQPEQAAPQAQQLDMNELVSFIEAEEGRRHKVYKDTKGIATVGVGFNLRRRDARERLLAVGADYEQVLSSKASLTDRQIDALLQYDIQTAIRAAKSFLPDFDQHPVGVQMAIADMAFNLGAEGLNKFKTTKQLLMNRDYTAVGARLRTVPWYSDHPNRSERVIGLIESSR